jgi:formylmethanofuran dehydrogenase subunit E
MNAFICWFILAVGIADANTTAITLPVPQFDAQETDPPWLREIAQLHGQVGPWVVAGFRLGEAGRRAVGADGYFDLQVECAGPCQKPPCACVLDGLQLGTGATFGKRNLEWKTADAFAVKVTNIHNNKTAVVRPSENLLKILTDTDKATAHPPGIAPTPEKMAEHLKINEAAARQIAALPQEEIMVLQVEDK